MKITMFQRIWKTLSWEWMWSMLGGANKYEVAEKLGLELKEDDDDD